jgi:hypothetical protein
MYKNLNQYDYVFTNSYKILLKISIKDTHHIAISINI